MEKQIILSKRLEEQIKAINWARAEQKRLLQEKSERLSQELMEKMTPFIMQQQKNKYVWLYKSFFIITWEHHKFEDIV